MRINLTGNSFEDSFASHLNFIKTREFFLRRKNRKVDKSTTGEMKTKSIFHVDNGKLPFSRTNNLYLDGGVEHEARQRERAVMR